MIVRFDFRPESLINPPRKKTRKGFLLVLTLLFLFLGITGYYSFISFNEMIYLEDRIMALTQREENFLTVKVSLTAEIAKYQKQEAAYVDSLNIMNAELPTIEVLNAIDKSLPQGITLDSIKIDSKNVALTGIANIEENIVKATRGLLESGAFSTAQVPVANRIANERTGIKFSLALTPLPLSEVK